MVCTRPQNILWVLIGLTMSFILLTLASCAGGGNDNSNVPPAQTNQPIPPKERAPEPTPTTPPPPPEGHVFLSGLTISGVSATFTAPAPADGGQTQVATVEGPDGKDDYTAIRVPWEDREITVSLPHTGTATNAIDATNARVTHVLTGLGVLEANVTRFGDVLAGESGEVTFTAQYDLAMTPGALKESSYMEARLILLNRKTDELIVDSVDGGLGDKQGELRVTALFSPGDTGSLFFGVTLHSEAH